ncbi:MAG: DNA alkylation repair protein [Patescibacteria group bacterium]|nr:DNA alkylation repair protein [Patescibacteria group bacterium]
MTYQKVSQKLKKLANPKKAKNLARFFKTGKGEYGAGDIFLGIMVPEQRKVVKKFRDLPLPEIQKLLNSKFHEERLVGVLILVEQYQSAILPFRRGGAPSTRGRGVVIKNNNHPGPTLRRTTPPSKGGDRKEEICKFYLKNSRRINNWDLVDLSAPKIVGAYLLNLEPVRRQNKSLSAGASKGLLRSAGGKTRRKILYQLVKSKNIWERRIAVLATFEFIRNYQFEDSLKLAKILLNDNHDLIHKAVGWMLREIGKRDEKVLRQFLDKYAPKMPRTMLRYSIERLSEKQRQYYLLTS